ncbi:MAG: hypothetical protein GVY33_12230 [Alphaproteobacteria bacterium]|jgi:hypothetical protein|nr:hypothetical protein [Alphaproteobacteria bacterium]
MARRLALVVVVGLLVAPAPALAQLDRFFGRYVGDGRLQDLVTGEVQQRDLLTSIEPFGEGGFAVRWSSVVRIDGARDVPGVRHLVRGLAFEPAGDGDYYLRAPDYDPFRLRERLEPMAGDALAWATVDGDTLDIYVFAVTGAGAGELQRHRRVRTATGMRLAYTGLVDGVVVTNGSGRMVRVGDPVRLDGG